MPKKTVIFFRYQPFEWQSNQLSDSEVQDLGVKLKHQLRRELMENDQPIVHLPTDFQAWEINIDNQEDQPAESKEAS